MALDPTHAPGGSDTLSTTGPTIDMPELSRALSQRARQEKATLLRSASLTLLAFFLGAVLSAANQVLHQLGVPVPQLFHNGVSVGIIVLLAVVAYLVAAILVVIRQIRRPDLGWYPSRAASENIKSQ